MDELRSWIKLDVEHLTQDTIEALFDAHGHVGPYAFLALLLEAGKSINVGRPLALRYRAFARLARCDDATARAVVALALSEGLVEIAGEQPPGGFRVTFPKAAWWESRKPPDSPAVRMARMRAKRDTEH